MGKLVEPSILTSRFERSRGLSGLSVGAKYLHALALSVSCSAYLSGKRAREGEGEGESERASERARERERQTDRQTDRQIDRQTDRLTD